MRLTQQDPSLDDTTKVRNAVDSMFLAELESRRQLSVMDIGFLFTDRDSTTLGLAKYEMGITAITVASTNYYNDPIDSYTYFPKYDSISIDGDRAAVVMTPIGSVKLRGGYTVNTLYVKHQIELRRNDGFWQIASNKYSNEMTDQYPEGTDLAAVARDFAKTQNEAVAKDQAWLAKTKGDFKANPRQPGAAEALVTIQSGIYRGLSRSTLSSYAQNHVVTSNDLYDTTSYNVNFQHFNPNDCQNFASQCLWAGFWGTDSGIGSHSAPMVDNISGATDWWCDATTATASWDNVNSFRSMALDNYVNDKIGVQGTDGVVSGAMVGDEVIVTLSNGSKHALMLTNWTYSNNDGIVQYGELWYCAHTYNRLNRPLTDYAQSAVSIFYIHSWKESN